MTKVMLLTSSLFGGGAERVIATLARHLDRSKFTVTVAHLKERGGIGRELTAQGHDVVGIVRPATVPGRYFSFLALKRVIDERQITIVHSHTTYALTDGAICRLASAGKIRLVHTFHFGNYPHLPARYRVMEQWASRVGSHLVAVGHEQSAILRALYRIPGRRISTIHNGTDSPPPDPDREWASRLGQTGRTVIGTTATCIEQKGLDHLLDVAALMRQRNVPAVFVVAGEGPLRARLEARRDAMGLQNTVLFTGWKPNAGVTMTPLYDVLFQPSRWEAMSVVVLEAMACTKPVVATDVGDNRHVVQDGRTGYIVRPGDIEGMADRLTTLVASKSRRDAMGVAGRQEYERHYTAAVMSRAYEDVYDRVSGGTECAGSRAS